MYERTKETRPRRNLSLRVIYGDHDKIASPQVQRHSQSRLEDLAVSLTTVLCWHSNFEPCLEVNR